MTLKISQSNEGKQTDGQRHCVKPPHLRAGEQYKFYLHMHILFLVYGYNFCGHLSYFLCRYQSLSLMI